MDIVRTKNTGTYDHTTRTWRLRTKGVQISIKQLSIRYGVQIDPSEKASAPYWRRYLRDIEEQHQQQRKANSPLQERIKSIEAMLTRLSVEKRSQPDIDTTKVALATGLLQSWVDQQSHDRCWYYPEIFRQLCDVLGVVPTVPPNLPPRPEFESGCKRYQKEEYEGQQHQ